MTELRAGLYESLLTSKLGRQLGANADLDPVLRAVDLAEQPEVLARHVREAAFRTLSAQRDPAKRVELVNALLGVLDQADDAASGDPRQLLSLSRPAVPGTTQLSIVRPTIPLSDAALLTNAPLEPSLGAEVRAELETADQVDLLCAFVKWHGLRVLDFELKRLRERNKPMRVVTTTYMGATERRALDRLVREFGAEVKIQYDAQRTRLHAKAWLFRRDTQFDTAYVGSSNLSRAALLDGVEWNVRLSRIATPTLMAKFIATFDSYWNDATFETYDPDRDRDRLDDALAEASGQRGSDGLTISLSGLEVRAYPYQAEMLESIAVERTVHDRHRNLVVAATGTGKTVIAALDYRSLCEPEQHEKPSVLFVAHRQEILNQSLRTYREVLADANFGELYVGGSRPERWKHVFASVQSLHSYGVANLPVDAYEISMITSPVNMPILLCPVLLIAPDHIPSRIRQQTRSRIDRELLYPKSEWRRTYGMAARPRSDRAKNCSRWTAWILLPAQTRGAAVVLVAGGSGLAPIRALLQQIVDEGLKTDIALIFGARTQQDLYCLDEIEKLGAKVNGRFQIYSCVVC